MKVIHHNMLEIVKLLEEYGSETCKLFMALRCAVIYNSVDVASYLLDKYTYPLNVEYTKESDHSGYTLLTEPGSVCNAQITKLLLDQGADPAKPMCAARSVNAIMTAIIYRPLEVIVQYIRSGVNINDRSYAGLYERIASPFEISVLRGNYNVAEILLISGCSCGEFSCYRFIDNSKPELVKFIKKWKVQENNVLPLKQRCRSVILNHLSPRADMKIEKLPLPQCLNKFLLIHELDDIINAYNKGDED